MSESSGPEGLAAGVRLRCLRGLAVGPPRPAPRACIAPSRCQRGSLHTQTGSLYVGQSHPPVLTHAWWRMTIHASVRILEASGTFYYHNQSAPGKQPIDKEVAARRSARQIAPASGCGAAAVYRLARSWCISDEFREAADRPIVAMENFGSTEPCQGHQILPMK